MACYTKAASGEDYRHQRPRTCGAGGSATRSLAFAGCLTGGAASLPPSADIFLKNSFFVGYEDIVSGGPSHEFSLPNCLINRTPKIDFGNGFAHPRPGEGRRYFV